MRALHRRHVALIRIRKCGTTAGIEESVEPWDTLAVVVMETDIALSKIVRDVAAGEDSNLNNSITITENEIKHVIQQ